MRFARNFCTELSGGLGLGTRNLQSKRGRWSMTGELSRSLALEAWNVDRGRDRIQGRLEHEGREVEMTGGIRVKILIGLRT